MDSTDENCSAAAEANGGEFTVDPDAGHRYEACTKLPV